MLSVSAKSNWLTDLAIDIRESLILVFNNVTKLFEISGL